MRRNSFILFFLFLTFFILLFWRLSVGLSRTFPFINTKRGSIRGLRSEDGQYSMFLGIPYAKVEETNPFGPSTSYPNFEDTFEAFDDSAVCPHINNSYAVGKIDCLNLNIYVPIEATAQKRLPVMVWLHGGGFVEGSGNREIYHPEFLVRRKVIVVTVNYRLIPYGSMCLDLPRISGNQGLKDQNLAFRWIHENIQAFGGDIDEITAFGESAGANSIRLHLLSNNEIYFNKVIIQSASALTQWRLMRPNNITLLEIASRLDFNTKNVEEALMFLAEQPSQAVTAAAYELGIRNYICIEKKYDDIKTFISENPLKLKSTKIENMPVLIGFNSNEMLFLYGNAESEFFENYSFYNRLSSNFPNVDDEISHIVRNFYIGDEILNNIVKQEILDFEADITYNHPTERILEEYMMEGAKSIYYYFFAYDGGRNLFKIFRNITGPGAGHGDELGYLFSPKILSEQPTDEDQLIIDRMSTMWTNFAKFGNPTPHTSDLLPVKWKPVTESIRNYLEIDYELKLLRRPLHKRMAFWNLFYKYYEQSKTEDRYTFL